MKNSDKLEVATIGKVVGLSGELKLHLHTDFIDQFKKGANFFLNDGKTIEIESYNEKRGLVKFHTYNVREDSAKLTNKNLFVTIEKSREVCELNDGEFFWFDIIGSEVIDNDLSLGIVKDIQRIADVDYLVVITQEDLVDKSLSKRFLIPYIDRYVVKFDDKEKKVYTQDAYDLLEAS